MQPPAEGLASRLFLAPALRTQPDRRLVTLVREGYEAAFEEIVRRYGRSLGRYAASIVGGRSEDVLQDAFAKALPALRRDDAEIDLRPWLFSIVRNTALNDLRDSPPAPELLADALAGGSNPADELEQREEMADLMRRLRALPEAQRAAIVMRELEGLGHEEIATALGLSGGGARQAIYRARQALRDGAGILLPLPLLRLLVDHGGEAAGVGAGSAIAAAGASAGGAGVSGALKVGFVAAVLAGSVGAGVAVHDQRGDAAGEARLAPARSIARVGRPAPLPGLSLTPVALHAGASAGPPARDGNRPSLQSAAPTEDGGVVSHGQIVSADDRNGHVEGGDPKLPPQVEEQLNTVEDLHVSDGVPDEASPADEASPFSESEGSAPVGSAAQGASETDEGGDGGKDSGEHRDRDAPSSYAGAQTDDSRHWEGARRNSVDFHAADRWRRDPAPAAEDPGEASSGDTEEEGAYEGSSSTSPAGGEAQEEDTDDAGHPEADEGQQEEGDYLASSQSRPTPMSTSSDGSSR